MNTCKLNAIGSSRAVCDIIHGTPKPDFSSCVRDGHVAWAPGKMQEILVQNRTINVHPMILFRKIVIL